MNMVLCSSKLMFISIFRDRKLLSCEWLYFTTDTCSQHKNKCDGILEHIPQQKCLASTKYWNTSVPNEFKTPRSCSNGNACLGSGVSTFRVIYGQTLQKYLSFT